MGGVGKVKSGKRMLRHRCRPQPSKSLSVSPLSATASRRLFTSCGGLARCNKWPAAEESRLRQKRDAEPFLLRRARHFLRRRQQCPSPPRALSLSSPAYYSRRESGVGRDAHPSHLTCRACMALSKAKHTIFCYRSLPPCLPDPLRPPSLPFSLSSPCGRPTD